MSNEVTIEHARNVRGMAEAAIKDFANGNPPKGRQVLMDIGKYLVQIFEGETEEKTDPPTLQSPTGSSASGDIAV